MYQLADTHGSSPATSDWFQLCVLEMVRTVQSALCLFGLFSMAADERDGLLCDSTVDGMQQWANDIGAYFDLEVSLIEVKFLGMRACIDP